MSVEDNKDDSVFRSPLLQWVIPGIVFISTMAVNFYQVKELHQTQKSMQETIHAMQMTIAKMELKVDSMYNKHNGN